MKAYFGKDFEKAYKKLQSKVMHKVDERVILFTQNPFDPVLNDHALAGRWTGYRSINVSGDLRAVLELLDEQTAFFVAFGTHSQLYG